LPRNSRRAYAGCYRSTREDREKLAAAKLATRLTAATGESDLPDLLLHAGRTRADDEFIDITIYVEKGLDTQDVDMVTLQSVPTTSEDRYRWKLIREICASRGISLVGRN